jgi:hypothetical protein
VVMRGDLKAINFYVLRGTTFIANVVVAPRHDDTTKIWYMCLGHMSALGSPPCSGEQCSPPS